MATGSVIPLAMVCLSMVEGSQYLSQPYSGNSGYQGPNTQQYYNYGASGKGQPSYSLGRSYSNVPSFPYGSTVARSLGKYDLYSGPGATYYKNDRVDKPVYNHLQAGSNGKSVTGGTYNNYRYTNSGHDYQSRYGSYTLPPTALSNQRILGGHRTSQFLGSKASPGYRYPVNTPQPIRDSHIYEAPKPLKHSPNKKTGIYVIPTPSKLYHDGVNK